LLARRRTVQGMPLFGIAGGRATSGARRALT
ncbi:MAG: hypothetical protein AVDCRST_MAG38-803, partial [uncultured Solirubrobacteraceae bacterium]